MLVNEEVLKTFGDKPVQLQVRARLNVRAEPTQAALLLDRLEPGEILLADQLLSAENYLNTSYWYRLTPSKRYVWAGGVEQMLAPGPPPQLDKNLRVERRADGTIRPLSTDELMARYGQFIYTSKPNGSIVIDPPWESQNIVNFSHALLPQMGLSTVRVHKLALPAFEKVFDAIQAAGSPATDCLLTCAGTYVPRHIRRDSHRPLSSHSFGVAIDLNAEWNAYGARPQAAGVHGSVQELVPYFSQFGFAWGGHFSGASADGMHFDLAVKN